MKQMKKMVSVMMGLVLIGAVAGVQAQAATVVAEIGDLAYGNSWTSGLAQNLNDLAGDAAWTVGWVDGYNWSNFKIMTGWESGSAHGYSWGGAQSNYLSDLVGFGCTGAGLNAASNGGSTVGLKWVAPRAGIYKIEFSLSASTAQYAAGIRSSATDGWIGDATYAPNGGGSTTAALDIVADNVSLNAGQYVTMFMNTGNSFNDWTKATISEVPEPSSILCLGMGLIGALGAIRRRH